WLGIEDLGLVASMLDAQLDGAREQRETLLRARPSVLDNHRVGRLLDVWGETRDDMWLYDTQLDRWAAETLTPAQRREVERLRRQVAALRETVEAILALSRKLKDQTIERLMAKSDLELGVDWLLGGREAP
ncbi:MAG: hypothetical protein ACRD2W_01825, partial [Acidimicrobiales bacterium]